MLIVCCDVLRARKYQFDPTPSPRSVDIEFGHSSDQDLVDPEMFLICCGVSDTEVFSRSAQRVDVPNRGVEPNRINFAHTFVVN